MVLWSRLSSRRILNPQVLGFQNVLNIIEKKLSNDSKIKTGILMLNMGGPSTLDQVEPFLTRLFTDKDIIQMPFQSRLGPLVARRRSPAVRKKYQEIGGGSPILKWTDCQGKLMSQLLDKIRPQSAPHKHYVGFRYANPLMEDTLKEMEKDGVERFVAFSQYPQYSCSTTGSSMNSLRRSLTSRSNWSFIDRWPTHEKLLQCFADLISKELNGLSDSVRKDSTLLFTAHSLPLSAVRRGDPYPAEVAATVLGVMSKLNFSHPYTLAWQSKVGPVEWLSPQTEDVILKLIASGRKHLLLVPISFVNEHIETLHELDIEYGELAIKAGAQTFRRVQTPNDHPLFIECLADLVSKHLDSDEVHSAQLPFQCPLCTRETCKQTKQWITEGS